MTAHGKRAVSGQRTVEITRILLLRWTGNSLITRSRTSDRGVAALDNLVGERRRLDSPCEPRAPFFCLSPKQLPGRDKYRAHVDGAAYAIGNWTWLPYLD